MAGFTLNTMRAPLEVGEVMKGTREDGLSVRVDYHVEGVDEEVNCCAGASNNLPQEGPCAVLRPSYHF